MAIGIPVVAGVTTAAWDYAITQGGGIGGINWSSPECIDWSQVASAGGSGTIAAFEKIIALGISPIYIITSLYGISPTKANAAFLRNFGLDGEYLTLQNDPYYTAGGYGGQASAAYISIALFIRGLPTGFTNQQIPLTSPQSFIGTNGVLVANPGISVSIPIPVGGNIGLLGAGTSGLTSLISGNGGGGWSTGRGPRNPREQAAWDKVLADPWNGRELPIRLSDSRWPPEEGWVKMERTIDGVKIHWNLNKYTGIVEDMKIK